MKVCSRTTESSRFYFDYSDLEDLCADRELISAEIHATNDFYGQATILKRYAGLDPEYSLKAVLEHGLTLHDRMWDHDRDSELATLFSPSKWRAGFHRQLTNKNVTPIGFGYLYARQLLDELSPDLKNRVGTLAFPSHSTHWIKAGLDHEDYAKRLVNLPPFMHPVSVCLYWKEIVDGQHQAYLQAGLPVYSAGHMFDSNFLLRLHDLLRQHRFATANGIGTHLFAALVSGCQFVFTNSKPVEWMYPEAEKKKSGRYNPIFQQHEDDARRLFGEGWKQDPGAQVAPEQLEFVSQRMGTDCQKSPEELRRLFRQAERRHQLQGLKRWAHRRWSKIGRIRHSIAKRIWRRAS